MSLRPSFVQPGLPSLPNSPGGRTVTPFSMLQKYPEYGGASNFELIYSPGTGTVATYLESPDGRPVKFGDDGRLITE